MEEGLPTGRVNDICEGPEGFIWMASEGAGLLRYDGYDFETYGLTQFPVLDQVIYDSLSGFLFFHDAQNLWSYDGHELKQVWQSRENIETILSTSNGILMQADGRLWRWQEDSVMNFMDLPPEAGFLNALNQAVYWRSDSTWRKLNWSQKMFETGQTSPPSTWVKSEFSLDLSRLKFMHSLPGHGVALDGEHLVVWRRAYHKRIALPLGLSNASVRDVFMPSSGSIILIGPQALYRLKSPWESYYPRQIPILSLAQLQGEIYFSTAMGIERLRESKDYQPASSGLTLAMTGVRDKLFLGTERGLFLYEPRREIQKSIGPPGFIFSLLAQQNQIWVGSSSGVWAYSPESGRSMMKLDSDALSGASIFAIRSTAKGDLWMASYTQGLWLYQQGGFEHITQLGDLKVDSLSLSAFEVLTDGRLALATLNQGLFLIDPQSHESEFFDLRSLAFAEIRELLEIDGSLWIGTNKGLLSLRDVRECAHSKEASKLHFFGGPVVSRGLLQRGDSLIAAGEQGLYFWNIQAMGRQAQAANLGITKLSLLQEELNDLAEFGDSLEAYTALSRGLDLSYDQNYLRFNYSLKTLFYPEWVQYRYRLKGQSSSWTYAGQRREALFTDLQPGDYYFEVEARYPWQGWEMQARPYHFKIHTAFWRTLWFWTAVLLSIGILAYLWLQDRYRKAAERLILENELMEMERKALRLQMNPHFIFNALDSISSFIFHKDPKQAVRYLNNFAKLMRLTLESSMEHIHPVETEVSILKNYLELEKLRFSEKFDYEIEVDEEIDYDVGLPPMLVQPHVENAILHGIKPKDGKGSLKISFKLEGTYLCVLIDDDGIGREKAKGLRVKKDHRSMATQINKDRIALLRRSVDELIELDIKDKYNSAGEPMGTTVSIRLPAQEL